MGEQQKTNEKGGEDEDDDNGKVKQQMCARLACPALRTSIDGGLHARRLHNQVDARDSHTRPIRFPRPAISNNIATPAHAASHARPNRIRFPGWTHNPNLRYCQTYAKSGLFLDVYVPCTPPRYIPTRAQLEPN